MRYVIEHDACVPCNVHLMDPELIMIVTYARRFCGVLIYKTRVEHEMYHILILCMDADKTSWSNYVGVGFLETRMIL